MMDWISKTPTLWDWDNSELTAGEIPAISPCSADPPPLGLGLGKRTYFEDSSSSSSAVPPPPTPASVAAPLATTVSAPPPTAAVAAERKPEKRKEGVAAHVQSTRCQVEGCNLDLSSAKDYHRKHRVCEGHSKCPRVIVAGQERRFCQQCSRFHALSEFDQKKRSCRRRLSDHNARRRKPQPDTFSFGSARLNSSFFDERRQISFMWNKAPFSLLRPGTTQQQSNNNNNNSSSSSNNNNNNNNNNSSIQWEGMCDFKLCNKDSSTWINNNNNNNNNKSVSKVGIGGLVDGQILHLGNTNNNCCNNSNNNTVQVCNGFATIVAHEVDSLLPIKGSTVQVINQGPDVATATTADLDGAPDLRRALSLLSSPPPPATATSPAFSPVVNPSSTYWMDAQPLSNDHHSQLVHFSLHNGSAQEFRLMKPGPYETASATFFDSSQIH